MLLTGQRMARYCDPAELREARAEEKLAAAALASLRALFKMDTENEWPGGPRTMACLRCEGPFESVGKHNRLCAQCCAINFAKEDLSDEQECDFRGYRYSAVPISEWALGES